MGVGIFLLPPSYLLFVFSIVVVIIMLVMIVKRKATYKQKRDVIVNGNPYCNNTVVVLQEQEMQGVGADYNDAHSINQGEDEDVDEDGDSDFGYNPYEVVYRKVHSENQCQCYQGRCYTRCCEQKQEEWGKEEDRR